MPKDAPVNAGARDDTPYGAWSRVSEMQAKLHRWAAADPGRRFDDLFNLVHDPATLVMAFDLWVPKTRATWPDALLAAGHSAPRQAHAVPVLACRGVG